MSGRFRFVGVRLRTAAPLFALLVLAGTLAIASDLRVLTRPVRGSVRLVDSNQRIAGTVISWSSEGIDIEKVGDVGADHYEWSAIEPASSYELLRRLIDSRSADDWLDVGIIMLNVRSETLADKAFDVAERLDSGTAPIVERAMELWRSGEDPRGAKNGAPAPSTDDDGTTSPGGEAPVGNGGSGTGGEAAPDTSEAATGAAPWPPADDAQHAAETLRLKRAMEDSLEKASLQANLFETEHFLFYSDLSQGEARRWSRELDKLYTTMQEVLEIPAEVKLFFGKCVIVVFAERDNFLKFEMSTFGHDASRAAGLCHQRGQSVIVTFYRQNNDSQFGSVLIHETTHAFMYRYRTPMHLPTWANEGLADYIAGHLVPTSSEPQEHWQHARNFVMQGMSALQIMGQTYANGLWFDDNSYPVSHMLVRFMLKYKPRQFKEWIDDIKGGMDWEDSLAKRFGITKAQLSDGFTREMKSERGYSRLR